MLKSNGVAWVTATDNVFLRGHCGGVTLPEASCIKLWRIILLNDV